MDYTIDIAGSTTVSSLLAGCEASAEGLRAVWLSYPVARFVAADDFGEELNAGEATGIVLRTYDESSCMADALRTVIDELRLATECTCTFGHEGGYQLAATMGDICGGKGQPGDIGLMSELAATMASQAACDEGRAIGSATQQALDFFVDEIEAHITRRACATGACEAFQTYHVLVSRCTGCEKCLAACEDGAIMGKPGFVHVVDQRQCTRCGQCLEACPEGAIVRAGAKKPKTPPRPIPCKRK